MNVARINGRAAVVDGKIYVFAGFPNNEVVSFTILKQIRWTYFTDFPEASGGVVAVAVYNGLIYTIWRWLQYWPQTHSTLTILRQIHGKRSMTMWTPRTVSQACLVNGKIYLIGGATSENYSTDAVEMYDPATDTWWIKSKMPVPSAFLSCAVVNDKIYVFEGTPDWSTGGRVLGNMIQL